MNQAQPERETRKISIDEVRDRIAKNQDVTLVDSRSAGAWGESNVKAKGAVRIPPDNIDRYVQGVSPDEFIVVYCT
jgi:Rhodanese-like domain.